MRGLGIGDIYNIRNYVNLDEGFEDIAPEYFSAEKDIIVSFHLAQLRYHREALERWLDEKEESFGG